MPISSSWDSVWFFGKSVAKSCTKHRVCCAFSFSTARTREHNTRTSLRILFQAFPFCLFISAFAKLRKDDLALSIHPHGTNNSVLIGWMRVISRSVLLGMRNISDKIFGENQTTHFMFSNFFSENRTGYEIMWKNIVEPNSPRRTILHVARALHAGELRLQTFSEYLILIAFPRQQWLREHVSNLHSYICCLSLLLFTLYV